MRKVSPFPTTNETVAHVLRASLNLKGVPMGTTWGQFKQAVESFGITDGDTLAAIEIGIMQSGSGRIRVEDEGEGWVVGEMTQAAVDRG